ncbi:MAG: DUF4178 domain-containing protein [Nitrospinota bacterium]|nr:DUF4178 domain-containing protein [Nitrospinota bacterium]
MIWNKIFGKKEEEIDPLKDLVLSNLKTGYLVDYDMKTWSVTAHNKCEWSEGMYSDEWELSSGEEVLYLEREDDDEVMWTLTKKISIAEVGKGIPAYVKEHEDPPEEITCREKKYHLEDSCGGRFHKDGKDSYDEFIAWDYEDESEEYVLTIEQWSETSFEAAYGKYVEEYQFTNILPA